MIPPYLHSLPRFGFPLCSNRCICGAGLKTHKFGDQPVTKQGIWFFEIVFSFFMVIFPPDSLWRKFTPFLEGDQSPFCVENDFF